MHSREDLFPPEPKIEAFLTHLAVNKNVAPATQNQAMNALVFLYKRVLNLPLDGSINAIRADRKVIVPVVLTRAVLNVKSAQPDNAGDPRRRGPISWLKKGILGRDSSLSMRDLRGTQQFSSARPRSTTEWQDMLVGELP